MISREQFEAIVRADALKKHPYLSDQWGSLEDVELCRHAYIAARMEHEWPLLEALQAMRGGPKGILDGVRFGYTLEDDSNYLTMALRRIDTALSPYATKPIER